MSTKVALVTGASRGIGKGAAIALAEAGFDVAIAARTVHEGDGRDEIEPDRVLAGSLDSTAAAIEATGQRVLAVHLDLLDQSTWTAAVDQVIAEWSRIDVLVNNARHQRHDHKARFADVETETIESEIAANMLAPILLAKAVLPGMLERGSGTIIDLTSSAGYGDPTAVAEKGGYSSSYAFAKGGLHRLVPMLALELGDQGITVFNVSPGFVITEKNESRMVALGMSDHVGARPYVPGRVIAWLASSPEAADLSGRTIMAQPFAIERGIVEEWREDPPEQDGPSVF